MLSKSVKKGNITFELNGYRQYLDFLALAPLNGCTVNLSKKEIQDGKIATDSFWHNISYRNARQIHQERKHNIGNFYE